MVFGGGFARGAAQCGFIKGMMEYIDKNDITLISSSSIGSINALGFSNNKMDYLENTYKTTNIASIKNLRLNLKNKIVDDIINYITADGIELSIPLYVSGTCLNDLSTHYFYLDQKTDIEEIRKAINITLTFPFVNGLFKRYNKKFYLDGGATDNIPVYPFKYYDVDLLIILHFYPRYTPPVDLIEKRQNTTIIDIDVSAHIDNISTYAFTQSNLNVLFEKGYEQGKRFGEEVLKEYDIKVINEKSKEYMQKELEVRKNRKNNINAAIFFNKLQQGRHLG